MPPDHLLQSPKCRHYGGKFPLSTLLKDRPFHAWAFGYNAGFPNQFNQTTGLERVIDKWIPVIGYMTR